MSEGLQLKFNEDHLPNEKFFSWLKSNTALFLGQIAALASLVLFAASFGYYVLGFHAGETHTSIDDYLNITKQIVFILNIVFCFLFIVFSAYIIHDNKSGQYHSRLFLDLCLGIKDKELLQKFGEEARKYLVQFKICFLGYWCYLFSFYAFMASTVDNQVIANDPKEVWVILLNGFLFFLPFRMFSIITQAKNTVRDLCDQNKKHSGEWIIQWRFPFTIYFILSAMYFIIYCGFYQGSNNIKNFIQITSAISSCINLISLGLLISRLDSKLIGLPSWLTCVLFIYAAIQPLDIFLDEKTLESKMFSTISYVVVLIFKVYFFFIITYLMQTGRLYSYLQSSGVLSCKLNMGRNLCATGITSFESWLASRKIYIIIYIICLIVIILLLPKGEGKNEFPNRNQIIEMANIAACLLSALLLYFLVILKINKGSKLAENQLRIKNVLIEMKNIIFNTAKDNRSIGKKKENNLELPLKFFWFMISFFILTALLYVCLIFTDQTPPGGISKDNFPRILSIFFNTVSALMLFYAFVQIYAPSVRNGKNIVEQLYYFGVIFLLGFTIVGVISFFNHKDHSEFASEDLMPYGPYSIDSDLQFIYKFNQEKKLTELNYHEDELIDPINNGWIPYGRHLASDSTNTADTAGLYLSTIITEEKDEHIEKYIKGLIPYGTKIGNPLHYLDSTSGKLGIECRIHVSSYYRDTCFILNPYHFYLKDTSTEAANIFFTVNGKSNSLLWDFKKDSLIISHSGAYLRDTILTLTGVQFILDDHIPEHPLKLPSFLTLVSPRSNDWLLRMYIPVILTHQFRSNLTRVFRPS